MGQFSRISGLAPMQAVSNHHGESPRAAQEDPPQRKRPGSGSQGDSADESPRSLEQLIELANEGLAESSFLVQPAPKDSGLAAVVIDRAVGAVWRGLDREALRQLAEGRATGVALDARA